MAETLNTRVGGNAVGPFDNAEWWVAITGLLGCLGAGVRYILVRMDRNAEAERRWINEERAKLETAFNSRIETLEKLVRSQREDLQFMQQEVHRYVRHVGMLEGLLRANKIEVPGIDPPVMKSRI